MNMKKQHFGENNRKIYIQSVLNTKIYLDITEIGKNVKQILERKLISQVSNRCIPEGYVSSKNINIIQYSAGTLIRNSIVFNVVYECDIAHPVEGMRLEAIPKTITKAGIHAEVKDDDGNVAIVVFIARDHNNSNSSFHDVKEGGDKIIVKVIGIRFELNDPYICVIASLEKDRREPEKEKKRKQNGGIADYTYEEDVMDANVDGDFLTGPI
jgi:DNA-directed RNA polymerase subunit E'/Rpb7